MNKEPCKEGFTVCPELFTLIDCKCVAETAPRPLVEQNLNSADEG